MPDSWAASGAQLYTYKGLWEALWGEHERFGDCSLEDQ
jgi:hypothetical protein